MSQKTLFIDRDGTLIHEPDDFQVDSLEKLAFEPHVIGSLLALQQAGFRLVMVTNQDGLGTDSFPQADFIAVHQPMMNLFTSQGIHFDAVLICPHRPEEGCHCRKPQTGLLENWLADGVLDKEHSYVIGDRDSDMALAKNMAITGLHYGKAGLDWPAITQKLCRCDRHALVTRTTKETHIVSEVWLDREGDNHISTGIGFFDHMLEQIATHGGIRLHITVKGDLWIDDHHTVEDTALTMGEALRHALGDKCGIGRFGFVLPMDDCLARCALDLCGRAHLKFKARFKYQRVGDLSCEMIEHFFRSLSLAMACTLHLKVSGKNDHHRAESLFKAFGRTLRQAVRIEGKSLPSSKGVL